MFENSNYLTKISEQFNAYDKSTSSSPPTSVSTTISTTESNGSLTNDMAYSNLIPYNQQYGTSSNPQQYYAFDSNQFNHSNVNYVNTSPYSNHQNYTNNSTTQSYTPYYTNQFNHHYAQNYNNSFLSFPTNTVPDQLSNKPTSPAPTYSQSINDLTPEKPVMNDSGIDVISPQLTNMFTQQQVQQYKHLYTAETEVVCPPVSASITSSITETTDESVDDDEDESEDESDDFNESSKENLSEKREKSKTSTKANGKASATPIKPPKPYLEIIADAILSCKVKMMQLHEIYHYMESKYEYFIKNVNKSWRNSVRHNLSLNECFVKAGRGSNGKGNYWKIHPLCEKEFIRGCFRRKSFKQLIRAGSANSNTNNHINNSHGMSPYNLPIDYALNFRSMVPPPLPQQFLGSTNSASLNSFQYPVFNSNSNQQEHSFNQTLQQSNNFNYATNPTAANAKPNDDMIKNEASQQSSGFHPYRI